ncbi:MAG: type II toxin-antitoxin system VapC family toxin [Thermoanaerobaculia bacterium]
MGLTAELGPGPVALDTAAFVYFIEEHPRYLPVVQPVFEAIDAGRIQAATSSLTLLEVLVVPYREGDAELAGSYERILTRSRHLDLVGLSPGLLRTAAQLRAATGMKTPDAIQVAATLSVGCTALLTNDDRWPAEVAGLAIVRIDDYTA